MNEREIKFKTGLYAKLQEAEDDGECFSWVNLVDRERERGRQGW